MKDRFKLIILTGFLGAGKTTVLNAWLRTEAAQGTAILVNEFGAIDIDGPILASAIESRNRLMSLPNGCICCEVQEDLVDALITLADRNKASQGVLETTGLADPGAILRGIAHDPRLKTKIELMATICVVAAPDILRQSSEFSEAHSQMALADRIVISKTDLLDEKGVMQVKTECAKINPLAQIITRSEESDIQNLFSPLQVGHILPSHLPHYHSHGIDTFSVTLKAPLDADLFRDIFSFWIMRHAEKLLRMKGIVSFKDEPESRFLNAVHDVFTSEPAPHVDLKGAGGTLVFIGKDLPQQSLRADLERCVEFT